MLSRRDSLGIVAQLCFFAFACAAVALVSAYGWQPFAAICAMAILVAVAGISCVVFKTVATVAAKSLQRRRGRAARQPS